MMQNLIFEKGDLIDSVLGYEKPHFLDSADKMRFLLQSFVL